ncbi:rhodanese-like domain-containing protein [Promethearchaeum syntrophicum]|uniref:Rhodanese-like domain-containing protein n=1 Tax=Promethearchaeum syntrophicum TaxID=2594042 RepID=A0A5B9D9M4_9ARCH|nr:rhodanese-like domain-containing protein [Candidatus Prometheoarchaeum syntrophicum]
MKKNNKIALIATVVFIMATILGVIFIPQFLPDDNNTTTNDYEDISVEVAYNMINDTVSYPNLIILDVRNQDEYDSGHLNNSILIPLGELESRLNEIIQYNNTEIIVYCRSGSRSLSASNILASNGFFKVYNMLGGITTWIDAGYPTV